MALPQHGNLAVSTHSRPKAAGEASRAGGIGHWVSTHSRPKAAGKDAQEMIIHREFQHTAARRRLALSSTDIEIDSRVSTHSRPKAAGFSGLYNH